MNEILKPIAEKLGTDLQTMYKSIFSGTSSTGVGIYITNISNFSWEFQLNLISLFWGSISCIILTLLSLMVSDVYKYCKKRLNKNPSEIDARR